MHAGTVVRVAAVQAAPVILDADASVDKAIALIGDAAELGAQLAVFPECFISMYPQEMWGDADALWDRFYASAVEVPGPAVDRLIEACREHDIRVAIGVNEREPTRSGSVYNAMLILGPEGLLLRHRKLMPTFHERTWHAFGAGDDLDVVATPFGRVGGLICWENRMPLARYAVYRGHPQIWVAPTADSSDGWHSIVSGIAVESGAFVVTVRSFQPHSAFPADFPMPLPPEDLVMDATVFEPVNGRPIVEPLNGVEGIVVADCDLAIASREKRWFDVVGHYGREDLLLPVLTRPT
jgi:predicted amidohydrolase